MIPSRDAYDSDTCPVRDELLGEMYRASEHGLPMLVDSVSPQVRAMLALFCYRRSHLYALSLSIASSCSERDLVQIGGRVGSTLYALLREGPARRVAPSIFPNRPQPPWPPPLFPQPPQSQSRGQQSRCRASYRSMTILTRTSRKP